jgi:hypothetical protein
VEISLKPAANRACRIGLLALLLLPLPFSSVGLMDKIYVTAMLCFLAGSYRRAAFCEGRLERQLVIAFFPVRQ